MGVTWGSVPAALRVLLSGVSLIRLGGAVSAVAAVALVAILATGVSAVAAESAIERHAGTTRITTAVAVSEATFTSADTALLARADTYPDALTGTVLAHQRQAPLLLTGRDRVHGAVKAELERLGVEQVVLLGGTAAVGTAVRDDLATDYAVSRVAGPTRWATAVEVAQDVAPSPDTVVLATGETFPDAVAASAYAAHQGWPVLLTGRDDLPDEVDVYLEAAGSVRVVPIGGPAAISDAVLAELSADGHTVADRLAGSTRWATSHRVATAHANALGSPTDLWVATGDAFPDALTAGVAAAANGALLQLTPTAALDVPGSKQDVLGRLESQSACAGDGALANVALVGGLSALSHGVHFQSWAGLTCTPLPTGRLGWVSDEDVWVAQPGGADARVTARDVAARRTVDFSPTGRHAATRGARWDQLSLVNLTTGAVAGVEGHNLAWSLDGSQVAYSLATQGVEADVFVADADGTNVRRLVSWQQDLSGLNTVVDWSADGSEVFFFSGYDDVSAYNRLYAVNVDTRQLRLVADKDDPRTNRHFSFSPDRTRLALLRSDPYDNMHENIPDQLFLVDPATGHEERLLTRTWIGRSVWSPDASEIAVDTSDGPVRIDVATGTVTSVPREGAPVSWSPDGTHLLMREFDPAVDRNPRPSRLVVLRADGTDATVLSDYGTTYGSWSPDSRWVAYGAENGDLEQVSVDGRHRFTVTSDRVDFLSWIPDPRS